VKKGIPIFTGGLMDWPASFVAGCELVWREQDELLADLRTRPRD